MNVRSFSPRHLSFWPLQTCGWLLYTFAIITSNLPLRHHHDLITFRTTFVGCTFFESFVVYAVCRSLWRRAIGLIPAMLCCVGVSAALGFACSAASIWAEIHLGGGEDTFQWANVFSGTPGASFVLVAWSSLYFGIKHYKLSEQEKARAFAAEQTAHEAQLMALRYQLQPHFLFNTFNAISSLVVMCDTKRATEMISRLADLLRTSLDAPDTHFISLSDEMMVAKEYLAIEQVRFGPRMECSVELPDDTLDIPVPRFLLQPLLENAVRHGISHLSQTGRITIRARVVGARLRLTIQNDSLALQRSVEFERKGLGLQNTRARIHQIYGSQGEVDIAAETGNQFVVTLIFPIQLPQSLAARHSMGLAP